MKLDFFFTVRPPDCFTSSPILIYQLSPMHRGFHKNQSINTKENCWALFNCMDLKKYGAFDATHTIAYIHH